VESDIKNQRRPTPKEWEGLIAEWECSDLNQPDFCQSKNISYTSFSYWRTKLLKAKGVGADFLPAKVSPPNFTSPSVPSLTLRLPNGFQLSIHNHINKALLSDVFKLLETESC